MRFTHVAVAVAIACSGLPFAPASFAQDVELRIGPDGIKPVIRDRYRDRGGCEAGEARAAARAEGLRRAEVVRMTERSITVRGFTRRGPEQIRFANRPGCPII
ncbi:hypothetical protein [Pararhizobium arenae]|uniref:hypothetical protein n=1 Tax=Pararhizobium arenae TaxID=1856850 RepID=UPI00094AFC5F|nr:hypothetical protein [Pararhizobium arenae]